MPKAVSAYLPGQLPIKQNIEFCDDPGQFPGPRHCLLRFRVPVPQDLEHEPHDPQRDQSVIQLTFF